jgi:tight adherence protein B
MTWLGQVCALTAGIAVALLLFGVFRSASRAYLDAHQQMAEHDLAALFVVATGKRLSLLTGLFVSMTAGTASLLGAGWPVVIATAIGCLLVPRWAINRLKARRMHRIAEQLPDALAFWAGLLRSGQGLHPALGQLAEHQASPLGDELKVVARQCRLGVSVDAAVHELCERLALPDLRLLSSLLRVARDLGGNLGDSLLRLSDLLRSRLAMEARIRSLTAQGRLQGVIVGALPLVLLVVLSFMEPAVMSVLLREPLGWFALALIATLELLGFVLIRRIVAIEI